MRPGLSVLALVTDAFGGRGGIAQYNRDFIESIAAQPSVREVLVLPRHAPDQPAPPAKVHQVAARRGRFAYVAAATAISLSRRLDVVFCGHLFLAPLAAGLARLKGARLIVQMHGIDAWPRPSAIQRDAVEAADVVLCVSRYTRARVLGWFAGPPERVLVAPNTVQPEFTPGDAADFRRRHRLEGRRVLVTVARMDSRERYKGHDRVLASLPELVRAGHDVVYLIIGEGDDRPRLEAIAREVGVDDRVRFLGAMDTADMVEALRASDLFVMPSTGEGFGIAFLEAAACGTPVVGLSVAGAADALADGDIGAALADEAELASLIDHRLASPGSNGQTLAARVQARFGREQFARHVAVALKRALLGSGFSRTGATVR